MAWGASGARARHRTAAEKVTHFSDSAALFPPFFSRLALFADTWVPRCARTTAPLRPAPSYPETCRGRGQTDKQTDRQTDRQT